MLPAAGRFQDLLGQFRQLARDAVGPDLIALRGEVQEVGHDFLRQRTVGLQEFLADVQIVNALAVVEFGDRGVDHFEFVAAGVRAGLFAARENREQKNLGLWLLGADGLDNLGHALGDALGGIAAGIVRANLLDEIP